MRWLLKAAALGGLSSLPYGRVIYRRLQDACGTARLNIEDHYGRKLDVVRRLRRAAPDLAACDVLEIGTGWYPVLSLLLSLAGTRQVATVDVNHWLTPKSLGETLRALRGIADQIARDLELSIVDVRAQIRSLAARVVAGQPVTSALAAARIRYEVPVDGCATGFPAGSFDFVLSTNLLEHVSPAALRRLHAEQHRLLRSHGLGIHRVNPGDHFAAVDPRITTINFLRYSPRAWYWLGGSGLAYHNRLRCCDHAELLREASFAIDVYEPHLDRRALEALAAGQVRPHSDFAGYSAEQLCEDVVAVEARRIA